MSHVARSLSPLYPTHFPGSSSHCRKVATRVNSPSVSALPLKIPYHTASFHFRNIRVLSATKGTSRLNNQWIARPHAFGWLPHPILTSINSYFSCFSKPSLFLLLSFLFSLFLIIPTPIPFFFFYVFTFPATLFSFLSLAFDFCFCLTSSSLFLHFFFIIFLSLMVLLL